MSFVTKRVETLNHNYKRVLKISYIIVLLLIIAAFKFAPQNTKPQQIKPPDGDIPVIPEVNPTNQLSKPPPPPKPPVPIEASIDDEIEDIILPPTDINFHIDVPPVPAPPKPPEVNDEIVPFQELESYPEPVGGIQSIMNRIHYTEIARRAGIEGTVTIEAILSKKGDVTEARVVKGIGGGLDTIALEAVKDTKFIPGMQRDKPVKVKLSIPVVFRLQ
jgi:protein TonB